jgi:hypothetical protein
MALTKMTKVWRSQIENHFFDGVIGGILESIRDAAMIHLGSHSEIADMLGCGRSAYSHFSRGGGIRAERLLRLVIAFPNGFDDLCSRYRWGVFGYENAMTFARSNRHANCRATIAEPQWGFTETMLTALYLWRKYTDDAAAANHDAVNSLGAARCTSLPDAPRHRSPP